MLKTIVRSVTKSVGFDIVRYPLSPLARKLRDFFEEQQVNLVIDVGAFDGHFCRMIRGEAGYGGKLMSVEPCAATFRSLQQKMSTDGQWSGLKIALSDHDGDGVLNTFGKNGDWNSLLSAKADAIKAFDINELERNSESVTVRKLKSIWTDIVKDIESPRVFLKMDTQGNDVNVFKGALELLDYIVGVQSELSAVPLYNGATVMKDAIELFGLYGYSPIGFYEVAGPRIKGVVAEFDGVFAKVQ